MRNYHVLLANGNERNIWAKGIEVDNGALLFISEPSTEGTETEGAIVVAYAPGTWVGVETEQKDDKGYPGDSSRPERVTPVKK
jgi:hypothetical protein